MLIAEIIGAVLAAGWLIDRATAAPAARRVPVRGRLAEARRIVEDEPPR